MSSARPQRKSTTPANTPCRSSPPTWWRPPRTCGAASTACRQAPTATPEIVIKVREGLAGVERSFLALLERNGIRREDPVGQTFDPNLHQAMAEQESELHPPAR